jgi:transposase-like protein
MEARQRRSFTNDYKRQAVDLVASSGRSIGSVAKELGLRDSVLRRWVEQRGAGREPTAPARRISTPRRPLLGSLKAACRPTRVDCLHRVPDNRLLDMLALRTFERQKVGMGGTRLDPGQHHPAPTLRAAGPLDGKQRRVGMTIGFGHDASPALGGSATLSHR